MCHKFVAGRLDGEKRMHMLKKVKTLCCLFEKTLLFQVAASNAVVDCIFLDNLSVIR